MVDVGDAKGTPPGPTLLHFYAHFREKWSNSKFALPGVGARTFVCEILDPPLELAALISSAEQSAKMN